MTWNGTPGRVVFWRSCATSPSIPASTWTGPTGFSAGRDDMVDEGKGGYAAGELPITGAGMVDIEFSPMFAIAASGRRIARIYLNGINIGQAEDTSAARCSVLVVTHALVKPGDVINFQVYQTGDTSVGLETAGASSYMSVLSR